MDVKEEIALNFEKLYVDDSVPRPSLEGLSFPSIPDHMKVG